MARAQALAHTATQKVAALMSLISRKQATCGKQTPKELAVLFESKSALCSPSEKFTETYIKAGMYVWEKIMKIPLCLASLLAIENPFCQQSPLNSV